MIWDNYKRTRWLIVLIWMAVTPLWLTIAVLETRSIGPSGETLWRTPLNSPGVLSEWLMCFSSILLIPVCSGYFGRGRAALVVMLVLDAFWLLSAGCLASYLFGLYLPGFAVLWFAGAAMLMSLQAAAQFFVTYLLIRDIQIESNQLE
jgi:hypothetical protein